MQSLNREEIQLARRDGRYSQPCVRGRGHLYRPTSTLTPLLLPTLYTFKIRPLYNMYNPLFIKY